MDRFNSCIEQGKFPDALKIVEIMPIFKKNDPNQKANYRPISLLLQFSKILEKLMYCILAYIFMWKNMIFYQSINLGSDKIRKQFTHYVTSMIN